MTNSQGSWYSPFSRLWPECRTIILFDDSNHDLKPMPETDIFSDIWMVQTYSSILMILVSWYPIFWSLLLCHSFLCRIIYKNCFFFTESAQIECFRGKRNPKWGLERTCCHVQAGQEQKQQDDLCECFAVRFQHVHFSSAWSWTTEEWRRVLG